MYGYGSYNDITPEEILKQITQEQIFEFILVEKFEFGKRYRSPLRDDNKANCRFEQLENGTILWVDFGDTRQTHRSCWNFVFTFFNTDLQGAIDIVVEKFNLDGNSSTDMPDSKYSGLNYVNNTINQRKEVTFWYEKKIPDREDRVYWNKRYITLEQFQLRF